MKILIDGQTLSTPEVHRGIGEVFLRILHDIILLEEGHQFFLSVYDDYDREPLQGIENKVVLLSLGKKINTSKSGNQNYTESIIKFVSENEIDCFWIPNPVMPNVNFLTKSPSCRVIVTFYDLIPLIFKDIYLNKWPNAVKENYSERLNILDSIADIILPISDSTKDDLCQYLKISPEKMRTIYLGSKRDSNWNQKPPESDNSYRRYILYIGGFDPRKNMENSVVAFKSLLEKYHYDDLNYIIVCGCNSSDKAKFYNFVRKNGLLGKVKLTGYVPDSELSQYYQNAELLFFPSLYEGFGLPVVDAMAYGLPVAVSDRSSLPEIAGDAGICFDPDDTGDMAEKLHRILSDSEFKQSLSINGFQQSKKYNWRNTAKNYLQVMESRTPILSKKNQDLSNSIKKKSLKIAYFSPLYPQISGISQYSKELLQELYKYAEIDLFLDHGVIPEDSGIKEKFRYYCYTEFEDLLKKRNYDEILYHIGNNPLHDYIYQTALKHPGIVILHDYVISPFIMKVTFDKGSIFSFMKEIYYIPLQKKWSIISQIIKHGIKSVDVFEYPLNDRIVKSAKTVIVHSQYVRKLLKRYPHVYVIPHGRYPVNYSDEEILENKRYLQVDTDVLVISVFGFMNWNKRINVVVRVFNRLQKEYSNLRLLLVGEANDDLKPLIDSNRDFINSIGFVHEETYYKYLSISDIVINLRFPTMGETSGTLLDAMGFGKPVIVSDVGSYRETPDNCCWKVDLDEFEEELLYQYLKELIRNRELREIMGKNGREYIKKSHDWEKIALEYISLINDD